MHVEVTFVKLKPLLGATAREIEASFDALTGALQGAAFSGMIRVTLIGDLEEQRVTISVEDGNAQRVAEAGVPDIEIITAPETWLSIAAGALAPLDAFISGRMRVRGDYRRARSVMLHLADGPGRTDFCEAK
jgi:hypothetical protein